MKKLSIAAVAALGLVFGLSAADKVELDAPDFNREMSLMQAFQQRQSQRKFDGRELSKRDMSDLLWCAYGINRADGRHTAASAMNRQDVEVYVLLADGAYSYSPSDNSLVLIAAGDHRDLIAGKQKGFPLAPVNIVIVSDISRFGNADRAVAERMGAMDSALVSQNIALFCAGAGLATVPRVSMDEAGLRKQLNLSADCIPMLNHPVGYPAAE